MADWPGPAELKQVLDIESTDWDETVDRVLSAAIRKVKYDVGVWDDTTDEPDDSLAQAALRMAELISLRPSGGVESASTVRFAAIDPTYQRLISGHRRRFPIA
jgi:hypothetical protein